MIADDLLDIARRLADGNPTQTDLRRAVSSVYYAVFHAICQSNADTLVGEDPQSRDQGAWRQAYRALDHGYARRRCQSAQSDGRFSSAVCELADRFVFFQSRRHRADYDPDESFTPQEAMAAVTQIDDIINDFRQVSVQERCAFAVYILMRERQD